MNGRNGQQSSKATTNSRNALLSTGPITPEGKARVAHNSVAHGLYTEAMAIRCGPLAENLAEVQAFARAVHDDLAPVGPVEEALADRAASLLWRLRRPALTEAVELGRACASGQRVPTVVIVRDFGREPDEPPKPPPPPRPPMPLEMTALAPSVPATLADGIARTESHLSRELARTLAILDAMQRRRAEIVDGG
jgi:hypothetical protein